MPLALSRGSLRPWRRGDEPSLVRYANNRNIWRNLRDRFPHPYTAADADAWITKAEAEAPVTSHAIVVDGETVGGVGVDLGTDVRRRSAEIGYWLGEPFWGRGIATKNGYVLEGRARLAVVKDGRTGDRLLYALVRP
ncbi:MAG TPA: GNAT family N-acetyltransferase [Candidatus Acidoferrum sp.]|jgi:ribosomal-protein-alanine N-acetyltransferase|nr:GNAT family N-acetyltransferase [Candidatus Acidoferrum sp.]